MQEIANDNARKAVTRASDKANKNAVEPSFKIGDRVLLHSDRVKIGDAAKLTGKYSGSYLIIDTRPGYNYKLKELITGKELKHYIHASRLRPLLTAE